MDDLVNQIRQILSGRIQPAALEKILEAIRYEALFQAFVDSYEVKLKVFRGAYEQQYDAFTAACNQPPVFEPPAYEPPQSTT